MESARVAGWATAEVSAGYVVGVQHRRIEHSLNHITAVAAGIGGAMVVLLLVRRCRRRWTDLHRAGRIEANPTRGHVPTYQLDEGEERVA